MKCLDMLATGEAQVKEGGNEGDTFDLTIIGTRFLRIVYGPAKYATWISARFPGQCYTN